MLGTRMESQDPDHCGHFENEPLYARFLCFSHAVIVPSNTFLTKMRLQIQGMNIFVRFPNYINWNALNDADYIIELKLQ